MEVNRHVYSRLQPKQDREAGSAKTTERIVVMHRLQERADHDEGKQRDQNKAEDDAEFLRRHGEYEIGVSLGQDTLDCALAGAAAEPPAADERFRRDVDIEGVARRGVEKAPDALRHV